MTNAKQFVEACLSYNGIKNVNVVECRFKPIHQTANFCMDNIKKFRNFAFERHGIRVYRAWDIGEGLFLPYNQLIHSVRYCIIFHFLPRTRIVRLFTFLAVHEFNKN